MQLNFYNSIEGDFLFVKPNATRVHFTSVVKSFSTRASGLRVIAALTFSLVCYYGENN
jgi:hypothetical protein